MAGAAAACNAPALSAAESAENVTIARRSFAELCEEWDSADLAAWCRANRNLVDRAFAALSAAAAEPASGETT
jgi:hypothetical protein